MSPDPEAKKFRFFVRSITHSIVSNVFCIQLLHQLYRIFCIFESRDYAIRSEQNLPIDIHVIHIIMYIISKHFSSWIQKYIIYWTNRFSWHFMIWAFKMMILAKIFKFDQVTHNSKANRVLKTKRKALSKNFIHEDF